MYLKRRPPPSTNCKHPLIQSCRAKDQLINNCSSSFPLFRLPSPSSLPCLPSTLPCCTYSSRRRFCGSLSPSRSCSELFLQDQKAPFFFSFFGLFSLFIHLNRTISPLFLPLSPSPSSCNSFPTHLSFLCS